MPWSLCPRIVRRAVAPALPLLLCLLAAPPCLAQAPSDRLALDAFRDSLARVGAVDSLAGFDSEGSGEARALRTLRAGLVLLRRGELGRSRDPYDAAIRAVERALDLHADWPYAWYASGLVRLAMWDHGLVAKATHYQHAGESYRAAAMTAFGRALEADSGFVPAAAALSGILLSMGHGALPNRFTDVLQRAAVVRGMPASVPLVLARLRYAAGDLPDALAALAAYGDAGGDAGLQSLERARVLVASGRTEDAVRAYEAGLEVMGEDGRAEYRNDLAWIGTTGELARFDSLPANEVAGWIHNFWRERDVLSLRQSGERLAEHLRRWAYVHRCYLVHRPDDAPIHAAGEVPEDQQDLFAEYDEDVSVVMTSIGLGVPGFAPYRRTQWEIDDRGVIYLRHGEPDQTAFDPAAPPNESWAYDLPEGRRIFHFMGSRALGTTAATTLVAALPMDPDLLDSRGALDPRYSRIASDMQRRIDQVRGERVKYELANPGAVLERMQREAAALTGAAAAVQASAVAADKHRAAPSILEPETVYREVAAGRNAIAAALSTDGFPQHFDAALDAVAQVYAVGVSPEDPRLLVAFAVPGKRLAP
ncbi:MAG TPA: hypothetical protein VNH46_10405, partial [Gemmatimonadales bacterium]|nr:hypothetical protein [Gemmatimonadales bacterium]